MWVIEENSTAYFLRRVIVYNGYLEILRFVEFFFMY